MLLGMGNRRDEIAARRRNTFVTVGAVSDKLLRDLIELRRIEKTGGQRACANPPAGDPAQGGSGDSRGSMGETTAPVPCSAAVPTASVVDPQGKGAGGVHK